jgi:hypothetical protein
MHGGRPKVEYFIPLDIAKHIGMASRTQTGREVRDYFIELEQIYSQPKELTFADVTEFLSKAVRRQRAELRAQQLQIAQLERSQVGEEQQREQLEGRVDGVEAVLDLVVEHITTQFTPATDWIHANDPIFRPHKKHPSKTAYDTDAESTQAGLFSKWVLSPGYLSAEGLEIRKEPLHGSMTMGYPPWFMAKDYPQFKSRT